MKPKFTSKNEKATKVPCTVTQILLMHYIAWHETCILNSANVQIDSKDVEISSNFSNVTVLHFDFNEKVLYLPVGLLAVFPSLFYMDAGGCSLEELSKENFQGLKSLSYLWLRHNKIKVIESETFRDLDSLLSLDLSKNFFHFSFS